jgi:antitoxin (DNA-binding transcriptional repressor) of toxin-antitoxin stability system
MRSFTVRELRYRFSEVEARLQKDEEVEPIARLIPIRPGPDESEV